MKFTLPIVSTLVAASVLIPASAHAKPCQKHTNETKVTKAQCQKAHERIKARDRMKWPPNPSNAEIIRRIGIDQWRYAEKIAYCETGGNLRHFPDGKYIGMMGMYRQTYNYGARATSYPSPHTATKAQQIAIAVAAHPITRGWSGWACS